jgi:hypothetical protein
MSNMAKMSKGGEGVSLEVRRGGRTMNGAGDDCPGPALGGGWPAALAQ